MLKFHQIILRKFLLIFSALFIVVGGIVYFWIKNFYIEQNKASLLDKVEIISFNIHELSDLESVAIQIKKNLNLRLTVVGADGTVLADSYKYKSKMDNHRYRDEIMQSDKAAFGYKIRHSNTLNKDLLYIAKKYTFKNEVIYIRLAKELESIQEKIVSLGIKIFIVLSVFFIFILSITYKMSAQIEKEIQKIVTFFNASC